MKNDYDMVAILLVIWIVINFAYCCLTLLNYFDITIDVTPFLQPIIIFVLGCVLLRLQYKFINRQDIKKMED